MDTLRSRKLLGQDLGQLCRGLRLPFHRVCGDLPCIPILERLWFVSGLGFRVYLAWQFQFGKILIRFAEGTRGAHITGRFFVDLRRSAA